MSRLTVKLNDINQDYQYLLPGWRIADEARVVGTTIGPVGVAATGTGTGWAIGLT